MTKAKDRRKFLADMVKGSAAFQVASPLTYFIDSILTSALASADPSTVKPRKLISIQQPQAPARWMFDTFLTPYMTPQELATFDPQNKMIGTRFTASSGRNVNLVYQTVQAHGINAPYMWGQSIPTPGGSRPMADLLLNLLSLQGINTTNAGHTISRSLHFLPAGASQSISAMSSDYSNTPLGTVAIGLANHSFKSLMHKSVIAANYFGTTNRLQTLLAPFVLTGSQLNFLDSGQNAATTNYQKISRLVDTHGRDRNASLINSIINKSYAHEMMLDGFADLSAYWTGRMAVYNDLITRAVDQNFVYPGFNDFPVGRSDVANRDATYSMNTVTNIVKFSDLNELFSLSTLTSQMSANFVLAEYLILNDLSSSVCIGIPGLINLKTGSGLNSDSTMSFDEHFCGMMVSPLVNFWSNRALASCLMELTSTLRSKVGADGKTYFDETIIELHGDFHRSPRADGTGSDHGSDGKSITYLSGAINGPVIVGALGRYPTTNLSAPGVWGQGAVDPVLGKWVTNADAAATTANLLRVPSTARTASPMALLDSTGQVTPVATKTKIVA